MRDKRLEDRWYEHKMNEHQKKVMVCREGKNCWCCPDADRVSFLIDGAAYFEAFVQAVQEAQQTIYIAGWDIDSRLRLDRREKFSGGIPELGDFLNQAAKKNTSLNIYILAWDFPMMYLRERQWLPTLHLGWNTHRRVHFQLDSEHPLGASHHQKIVVIDDHLAFCGGMDLTRNRWDTREHRIEDSRRTDTAGKSFGPYHDVQMAVSGEAARALGMLFRKRWQRANGRILPVPRTESTSSWPHGLAADIDARTQTAIARTLPEYKNQESVREVKRLYLDAIASAKNQIYIENQYFTADRIRKALGNRLAEDDPPEVVMIMPRKASGWLEQSTMDAIRSHQLQQLYKQDHKNRLGVYYPVVGKEQMPVYVHSKLMVVDDRMAVVGSANLSNRSMGLDSECCLAVEAEPGDQAATAIAGFRRRLLADHCHVSLEKMADVEKSESSLLGVIHSLAQSDSGLKPLDGDAEPVVDGTDWISDETYLDPHEPFMLDRIMDRFAHNPESRNGGVARVFKGVAILLFLIAVAGIWRWTPLADWMTREQLVQLAGLVSDIPILMLVVVGGFIVGGLIFVPITLMVGAAALILPPWQGFACAMAGTVLNAWATYLVGRHLGKLTVRKLAGHRLDRLNSYLARQGILTMALVRNLPVAPFTVVNIVAGTTGIKLGNYLLGTAIGMLPGILVITVFAKRMLMAINRPNWGNIALAAALAGLMGLGFWWLRKRLKQKESS